jgi:hypothetical protein
MNESRLHPNAVSQKTSKSTNEGCAQSSPSPHSSSHRRKQQQLRSTAAAGHLSPLQPPTEAPIQAGSRTPHRRQHTATYHRLILGTPEFRSTTSLLLHLSRPCRSICPSSTFAYSGGAVPEPAGAPYPPVAASGPASASGRRWQAVGLHEDRPEHVHVLALARLDVVVQDVDPSLYTQT